jgi:hypothetical protein
MDDHQRFEAAETIVAEAEALRLVFAIDDTCRTLAALATDDGDPAMIADVIEVVLLTGDFSPAP